MLQTNMYFGTGGTDIKTHLQGLIKKFGAIKRKLSPIIAWLCYCYVVVKKWILL